MASKKTTEPSLFDSDQDVSKLHERIAALSAENTRLNDLYMRLLTTRADWERRVASARRREQQEWLRVFGATYAVRDVARVEHYVTGLIYRIESLPDKPGSSQISDLRAAAVTSRQVLKAHQDAPEKAFELAHDELFRLRDFVREFGRRTHDESGRDPNMCDCVGCQILIGMDVIGDDELAPETPGEAA